jgi:predicted DNA-binding transcriptional regulator AlpA
MSSEQNDGQNSNRTTPASLGALENVVRGESNFINEKELLVKLPISRRTLFNWRSAGKIPCVRLGGRRILFHWPSVEAALLRYQHGGNLGVR